MFRDLHELLDVDGVGAVVVEELEDRPSVIVIYLERLEEVLDLPQQSSTPVDPLFRGPAAVDTAAVSGHSDGGFSKDRNALLACDAAGIRNYWRVRPEAEVSASEIKTQQKKKCLE